MLVRHKNKVVNLDGLNGFTSIVNKDGKLSVYFGSTSELIGSFDYAEAEKNLDKITQGFVNGLSEVVL